MTEQEILQRLNAWNIFSFAYPDADDDVKKFMKWVPEDRIPNKRLSCFMCGKETFMPLVMRNDNGAIKEMIEKIYPHRLISAKFCSEKCKAANHDGFLDKWDVPIYTPEENEIIEEINSDDKWIFTDGALRKMEHE